MVRDWVLGGRTALDHVGRGPASTVAAVMGDAFATAVIDRVGVTRLEMLNLRMDPRQQTTVDIELEQPVDHGARRSGGSHGHRNRQRLAGGILAADGGGPRVFHDVVGSCLDATHDRT